LAEPGGQADAKAMACEGGEIAHPGHDVVGEGGGVGEEGKEGRLGEGGQE